MHVILIDPNLRVDNNETVASYKDVIDGGVPAVGDQVAVVVVKGVGGLGTVTHIDSVQQLIGIAVDWKSISVHSSLSSE